MDLVAALDAKLLQLPGVARRKSRWGDQVAYVVNGKEFLHFHSQKEVDIRLTKAVQKQYRDKLRGDSRVRFRPHPSDWIAFRYATARDIEGAVRWARRAWDANRLGP